MKTCERRKTEGGVFIELEGEVVVVEEAGRGAENGGRVIFSKNRGGVCHFGSRYDFHILPLSHFG